MGCGDCALQFEIFNSIIKKLRLGWVSMAIFKRNSASFFAASVFFVSPIITYANDIQIVKGNCSSLSHTAEGPIDSDLTKRQSKFFCNSAVISFFDDYKGHVLVQFVQKQSHHSGIIGFSGKVEERGQFMPVEHVFLSGDGTPVTVSDGACKFFFKGKNLSGIGCGVKIDETGRRTTAIVSFNAAPNQ